MSDAVAPATRIVLVRHGEAQTAVDQVVGGHQGCTGLSGLGRRQAAALCERLARTGELGTVDALWTSILPRAIETAELIAPALGGLTAQQDCDLCEIHPGEADGVTWAEFESRWAPSEQFSPFEPWAPGSESWASFAVRAAGRLRRLAADEAGRTTVVACHGGVIEASLVAFGDVPLTRSFRSDVANTSLTEWVLRADHRGVERWFLVRFNDAAHLADAIL